MSPYITYLPAGIRVTQALGTRLVKTADNCDKSYCMLERPDLPQNI